MLRPWIVLFLLGSRLLANSPGGGPESGAPDVTLTDNGNTVTLANGTVTATVVKDSGFISSFFYQGVQLVDTATEGIYYSMHGMDVYRVPSGCAYTVTTQTADMVDISLRQIWTTEAQPFDIEMHYVLRRGDTGIYTYALVDHPAAYPAGSFSIFRLVWKRPIDTFERLYVDDLRNREMPNSYDYANASPTSIAEIVHLNTGVLAGKNEGKYCYNTRYSETPVYGHATNDEDVGIWVVYPSNEWFNDGPTQQDLSVASYGITSLLHMTHFNASELSVDAGEPWRKLYGPFLLYCNSDPGGAAACWQNAQAQVETERSAWPYDWLVGNPDYPAASERAIVTGTIDINDPLKPVLDATGAWIGLAAPDLGGNWQFEGERYQHWVKAGPGGSFTIPHVRPGIYTLYCIADGETGEFESSTPVTVTGGQTIDLGTLFWNVPRFGSWLAWEIGLPDRNSREFRHGDDYFTPFVWDQFDNEFPNPLLYDVSSSKASLDWNFAQPGYEPDIGLPRAAWPWEIHFNLPELPATGNARLILAFAGSQNARVQIFVNSATQFGPNLYPYNSGGNGLNRQSSHAKYAFHTLDIPVSMLNAGANTITLLQGRYNQDVTLNTDHVMYDYVALEMPAVPGGNPIDADGDGLTDSWELEHFHTLSPSASEDSDGDGFPNSSEEAGGSDPTDPASVPVSGGDGDLIDDTWETTYYPSPFTAGPLDDTDGDGFNTWTEWKAGTDPTDGASKPGIVFGSTNLAPVADTAVWYRSGAPAYSSTNYGSDPDIDNYSYPSVPIIALGYFRFDLTSLPADASLSAATLSFTKISPNPAQAPQGTHSAVDGVLTTGRFAVYGLLDAVGNTSQTWDESTLSGDTSGAEFDFANAAADPPLDIATRTVDLDGVGEIVNETSARITGGTLIDFLHGRLDATSGTGLATFITDIEDSSNSKGYAFASRETVSGSPPSLQLDYTAGTPLPNPDEDADGLEDGWEAQKLGTLAKTANDDTDDDGTPEWLEQALGLNPKDINEAFRAAVDEPVFGSQVLSWRNAAGVTFKVQSSTTLGPPWFTETTISGSASPAILTHPIVTDANHRFYRISASLP